MNGARAPRRRCAGLKSPTSLFFVGTQKRSLNTCVFCFWRRFLPGLLGVLPNYARLEDQDGGPLEVEREVLEPGVRELLEGALRLAGVQVLYYGCEERQRRVRSERKSGGPPDIGGAVTERNVLDGAFLPVTPDGGRSTLPSSPYLPKSSLSSCAEVSAGRFFARMTVDDRCTPGFVKASRDTPPSSRNLKRVIALLQELIGTAVGRRFMAKFVATKSEIAW